MSINEIQEEIIQESKPLKNYSWMDKYNFLIKLGEKAPKIDLKYKTADNLLKNCQSKIWVHSVFKNGKIFFDVDSSSTIIRGIVVFLIRVLSGQKPKNIINADLYFINKVGLDEICSTGRINTFRKIVDQMKADAALYVKNK